MLNKKRTVKNGKDNCEQFINDKKKSMNGCYSLYVFIKKIF